MAKDMEDANEDAAAFSMELSVLAAILTDLKNMVHVHEIDVKGIERSVEIGTSGGKLNRIFEFGAALSVQLLMLICRACTCLHHWNRLFALAKKPCARTRRG